MVIFIYINLYIYISRKLFAQLGEYKGIRVVGVQSVDTDWRRRPRVLFGASDQPVGDHGAFALQFHVAPQLQFERMKRVQYVFGGPAHVYS